MVHSSPSLPSHFTHSSSLPWAFQEKSGFATRHPWRRLSPFANASLLAAALVLAACSSGSEGGVSFPQSNSGDQSTPTVSDARIVPFVNLEPAIARTTNMAPTFATRGSITQSSIKASISTAFDGSEITVTVDREGGGSGTILNSSTHSVQETLDRSSLVPFLNPPGPPNGHDRNEDWTLFSYSETVTSAAYVTASWNHNNPTDFLANGYWMLLDGNLQSDSISNAEVGAFIDGSEFSSAPRSLPTGGTATFRGRASGMYTFYYGPAWEVFDSILPGTQESGIYTSIVTLTADFANNTIEGCLGCLVPGADPSIVINETAGDVLFPIGVRNHLEAIYHNYEFDGDFSQLDPDNRPSLTRIILKPAPIDRNTGTFMAHDGTVFELDYFPGGTSTGQWGGKFSNRPVGDGSNNPRLVGGTVGVQWSHPTAGRSVSIGTFYATPDTP